MTLGLDYTGKAIIALNIGVSAAARATLYADQPPVCPDGLT